MLCENLNAVLIILCATGIFILYMYEREPRSCYTRFEYEYNVLEKIIGLTEHIKTLTDKQTGAETTIQELNQSLMTMELAADGASYIRWGRTSCPDGASIVYSGMAAGGHYTHQGSGSNRLYLPKEPIWGDYNDGFDTTNRLHGAEYKTSHFSKFKHLRDNDVPCVVCRIPRSDVLMVPGRNVCYDNYVLEYSGYLMSGYYVDAGASEFLCVDGEPETIEDSGDKKYGSLFYFVEATCGVLKCPPFVAGRKLTCAVCSYSPNSNR